MPSTMTRVAILLAVSTLAACTNPEVPQGYEGYIYNKPLLFGKMEFREALRGPATTGASWRLYTENVDMRRQVMRTTSSVSVVRTLVATGGGAAAGATYGSVATAGVVVVSLVVVRS